VLKGACLVLSALKSETAQKAEGFALMKKGLMFNLKSPVAWNLQGLTFRAEKQYAEAIKSYTMALKFDPADPAALLRDMTLLQAQSRSYEGFAESRRKALGTNPGIRANWSGFAVASQLAGRADVAAQTISAFLATTSTGEGITHESKFQNSEMHLYRNDVIASKGDVAAAYADLLAIEDSVVDTLAWHTSKARYALQLGKLAEAEAAYRWLLNVNCENGDYLRGLVAAVGASFTPLTAAAGLPAAQVKTLTALCDELATKYPRSHTVQRLRLDFLPASSPAFAAALTAYVQPRLRNAMPSLFRDISPLYASDPAKRDAARALMESYATELAAHGRFESAAAAQSESPVAVVWVYIYLALHCDYCGETDAALQWLDTATAHSPTLLDLSFFRAGILKHAGDAAGAYAAADAARVMDYADRYINCKTTQHALQAGCDEAAENTVSLFLKDESSLSTLNDLQCNWFFSQQGFAYRARGGQWRGLALRRLLDVEQNFTLYFEAQTEFHHYNLRKSTLRSYAAQLEYLDGIRQHKFYVRALGVAVEMYLELHAERVAAATETGDAAAARAAAVSAERAAIAAELDARPAFDARKKHAVKTQSEAAAVNDEPCEPAILSDPYGFALLDVADPLAEAARLVAILTQDTPVGRVGPAVWVLAARVHARRDKPLLALRAIKHARATYADLTAALAAGETARAKSIARSFIPRESAAAHAHAATKAAATAAFLSCEIDVVCAELLAALSGPDRTPLAGVVAEIFAEAAAAGELAGAKAVTAADVAAVATRVAARATAADGTPLDKAYAAAAAARLYTGIVPANDAALAAAADAALAAISAAAAPSAENAGVRFAVHALLETLTGAGKETLVAKVKAAGKAAYPRDTAFWDAEAVEAHRKANAVEMPAYE
jgi:peptide alpha-N-acetyltransferase